MLQRKKKGEIDGVIGERIRRKRLAMRPKMTAADLAQMLGVREGTVLGWEKGRYEPSIAQIDQIAEKLGTTRNYLVMS